jgi:hypothetical protein
MAFELYRYARQSLSCIVNNFTFKLIGFLHSSEAYKAQEQDRKGKENVFLEHGFVIFIQDAAPGTIA